MEIIVRKLFVPWVEGDGDEDEKVSGLRGARGARRRLRGGLRDRCWDTVSTS